MANDARFNLEPQSEDPDSWYETRGVRIAYERDVLTRKGIPEVDRPLTNKQRLFVEAYFANSMDVDKAAIQAGYSPRSAPQIASKLLKKPNVARAVEARMRETLGPLHLDADEVLTLLASHARGTMENFIDADSLTIDLKKAKFAKQLHLIKKFKVTTTLHSRPDGADVQTDTVEFELYDAQSAAVQIGKHLGLFNDRSINLNLTLEELQKLPDEELKRLAAGGKP